MYNYLFAHKICNAFKKLITGIENPKEPWFTFVKYALLGKGRVTLKCIIEEPNPTTNTLIGSGHLAVMIA